MSADPVYGTEGAYYVNSQVGEDLVTNPEAHSSPEEALLNADGTHTIVAYSNRAADDAPLMTDDQMSQLRRHLESIHERFAEPRRRLRRQAARDRSRSTQYAHSHV